MDPSRGIDAEIAESKSQPAESLLPFVYDELRKLAAAKMSHEAADQTLQPTAFLAAPGGR